MKTLAVITTLFLAQPDTGAAPQQSLKPNLHKTSGDCGTLPAPPQGCLADSARCVNGSWQWTC